MTLSQIAVYGAASVLVFVAATLIVLPRDVTVSRTASIAAQPEDILALAASNQGYQHFNPYRSNDPDLKIEMFGPDTGVGSGFRFNGKEGKGKQTVSQVSASAVHYAIDLGPMGQPKQIITAKSQGETSTVVWEMYADMGMNPIARVMGLFMERIVGATLEQGLQNLSTEFSRS